MSSLFGGGKKPKIDRPPPPPTPATEADASIINAGQEDKVTGFSSLINTAPTGLKRKAKTVKRSSLG